MDDNLKPEDMKKVFSLENMDFLMQHGLKGKFLRLIKEHFDVEEMLVIKEKKNDNPKI